MFNVVNALRDSHSSLTIKPDCDPCASISHLCGLLRSSLSTSSGGVKEIGPLTFTYGGTIQAFLSGNYAGLQCTTMALTAIIHSTMQAVWTPKTINKVLKEGNRLHALLRDEIKLSGNPDGKIALEDIPHSRFLHIGNVFGRNTAIKLRHQCQNVFSSRLEGFEDFLTIKEYLLRWAPCYVKQRAFLITLKEESYAIILKKNGEAMFFDSHGNLKLNGNMIKQKAGVLKLRSIHSLEEFIINMYGPGAHAVIAQVCVTCDQRIQPEKRTDRKHKKDSPTYTPYLPGEHADGSRSTGEEPTETRRNHTEEITDDPSAFIGMMGGGY